MLWYINNETGKEVCIIRTDVKSEIDNSRYVLYTDRFRAGCFILDIISFNKLYTFKDKPEYD